MSTYNKARWGNQTKVKINQELADKDSAKRIRHDLELVDEVIQKGFKTLNMMEVISPVTAIKAIKKAQAHQWQRWWLYALWAGGNQAA